MNKIFGDVLGIGAAVEMVTLLRTYIRTGVRMIIWYSTACSDLSVLTIVLKIRGTTHPTM